MLKGTTRIELKDVNTGEVEVIEKHNMVTNALNKIFEPIGFLKYASVLLSSFQSYYTRLLGGLLLFDNPIEEDPDNLYASDEVKLVGCGVYNVQNTSTGTARGNYNLTESEINTRNKYAKFVFDFNTSQANGPISCVCLSSLYAGYNGYGYKNAGARIGNYMHLPLNCSDSNGLNVLTLSKYTGANCVGRFTSMTLNDTEHLFLIDPEQDVACYFKVVSSNIIHIIKRKIYLKSVSLFDNPVKSNPIVDEIELELDRDVPTAAVAYNYDEDDNSLYIIFTNNINKKLNESFVVMKISYPSLSVSYYDITNTSDVTFQLYSYYTLVHRGYLYVKVSDTIYKINLSNSADAQSIVSPFSLGYSYIKFGINGYLYIEYTTGYNSTDSYCFTVNTRTKDVLACEINSFMNMGGNYASYAYIPVLHNKMLWYYTGYERYGDNWGGFVIMGNYLATINNLEQTVVKTADKTMKVTYIIEEA